MTYTVNIFNTDGFIASVDFKIKHFRLNKGRDINPMGGFTAMFEISRGLVFYSKCRQTEQFSRKKGILTCIQKMLDNYKLLNLPRPQSGTNIASFEFINGGVDIYLGKGGNAYFWLNEGMNL